MADLTDIADALQAEHIALGLARVDPAIPAGVAGECEDCGEVMPRLVGGRCGYCRDGRLHPFERGASGAPPRLPPPAPVKDQTMPNPPDTKSISFVVQRDAFALIASAAERAGRTPAAFARFAVEAAAQPTARKDQGTQLLDLAVVPLPDLLDELRHRVDRAAETTALLDRATVAEAKLAAIAGVMAPAGAGAAS